MDIYYELPDEIKNKIFYYGSHPTADAIKKLARHHDKWCIAKHDICDENGKYCFSLPSYYANKSFSYWFFHSQIYLYI